MVAMDVGASPPAEPKLGSTGKQPAPRKKILVRKVKPQQQKSASVLAEDSAPKSSTSRGGSGIDFVGGLETVAPSAMSRANGRVPVPPSPSPPPPASEAAVAPKGPAPGPDGKRPDWAVLGDVGEDTREKTHHHHHHLGGGGDSCRDFFFSLFKRVRGKPNLSLSLHFFFFAGGGGEEDRTR